eukprot:TRINITY_DN20535_c0_g1_i1.p1 TRINITY_DN20535_c0_g1~~TRINITY_DN20535_c0_g1_i1.p1  ORF type:complete len:790 (+),score=272.98 TRINITY_DN20535_c0_g1_i1:137-2506(+)
MTSPARCSKLDSLDSDDENEANEDIVALPAAGAGGDQDNDVAISTTPKGAPDEENGQAASSKRRSMDQVWEVVKEREFEERIKQPPSPVAAAAKIALTGSAAAMTMAASSPPATGSAGQGPAVVTGSSPASSSTAPNSAVHAGRSAEEAFAEDGKSSLRRVKQLEPALAEAVKKECGVSIGKADIFRIVLPNRNSKLKPSTRILIFTAGDAFLCHEPIQEEAGEDDATPTTSPATADTPAAEESGEGASAAAAVEAQPGESAAAHSPAAEDATAASSATAAASSAAAESSGGGYVEVELSFFRASPSLGPLAKRLGRVPVLHVALSTSDGSSQAMEFVGVHQRQYCVQEPAPDAIAQNLVESLLKVALEFVFHPSRSRYAKERLILRECSIDAEARRSGVQALPRMVEEIQKANEKIKKVDIEEKASRTRPLVDDSKAEGNRSFLVFDEDVLKISPAKSEFKTKAPTAKGAFKGLGAGFLNTDKAKRKGIGASAAAGSSSAAGAAAPVASTAPGSVGMDKLRSFPIEAPLEEKRKYLLGAAEEEMKMAQEVQDFVKRVQAEKAAGNTATSAAGEAAAAVEEAEDEDEAAVSGTIHSLANTLFGGEEDEGSAAQLVGEPSLTGEAQSMVRDSDVNVGDLLEASSQRGAPTESTTTPSPKASSRGGLSAAPSEMSHGTQDEEAAAAAAQVASSQVERPLLIELNAHWTPEEDSAAAASAAHDVDDLGFSKDLPDLPAPPPKSPPSKPASPAGGSATGIRRLLERRREEEKAEAATEDLCQDLTELWLKQRW